MNIKIQLVFAILLSFIIISEGFAQNSNGQTIYKNLMETINLERIETENYRLFLYMQKGDSISLARILNKSISKENFKSDPCFKIEETNIGTDGKNKITAYVDSDTFLPKYLEISKNGTVTDTYTFYVDKMIARNFQNKDVQKVEKPTYKGAFLSNSFTEIVQANDFGDNPKIKYQTFNPKNEGPPNTFVAERVGDKMITLPNGQNIDCWKVEFYRKSPGGKKVKSGHRYVEKDSGRVIAFKYDLDPQTHVAYQLLLFD